MDHHFCDHRSQIIAPNAVFRVSVVACHFARFKKRHSINKAISMAPKVITISDEKVEVSPLPDYGQKVRKPKGAKGSKVRDAVKTLESKEKQILRSKYEEAKMTMNHLQKESARHDDTQKFMEQLTSATDADKKLVEEFSGIVKALQEIPLDTSSGNTMDNVLSTIQAINANLEHVKKERDNNEKMLLEISSLGDISDTRIIGELEELEEEEDTVKQANEAKYAEIQSLEGKLQKLKLREGFLSKDMGTMSSPIPVEDAFSISSPALLDSIPEDLESPCGSIPFLPCFLGENEEPEDDTNKGKIDAALLAPDISSRGVASPATRSNLSTSTTVQSDWDASSVDWDSILKDENAKGLFDQLQIAKQKYEKLEVQYLSILGNGNESKPISSPEYDSAMAKIEELETENKKLRLDYNETLSNMAKFTSEEGQDEVKRENQKMKLALEDLCSRYEAIEYEYNAAMKDLEEEKAKYGELLKKYTKQENQSKNYEQLETIHHALVMKMADLGQENKTLRKERDALKKKLTAAQIKVAKSRGAKKDEGIIARSSQADEGNAISMQRAAAIREMKFIEEDLNKAMRELTYAMNNYNDRAILECQLQYKKLQEDHCVVLDRVKELVDASERFKLVQENEELKSICDSLSSNVKKRNAKPLKSIYRVLRSKAKEAKKNKPKVKPEAESTSRKKKV